MIPARYLDVADDLLRKHQTWSTGLWSRTCAWLLRLALEATLGELWAREHPAIALVTMRAQLLSLYHLRGFEPQMAARAEYLWACLSRAVHHHPYELSPTATELRRWHEDVRSLALLISQYGSTAT